MRQYVIRHDDQDRGMDGWMGVNSYTHVEQATFPGGPTAVATAMHIDLISGSGFLAVCHPCLESLFKRTYACP